MTLRLGLSPKAVFEQFALWQPLTYMFLHSTGGLGHILFNMLALWMFGTELERTWGTRFFTKYYFVTGVGAGPTSLLLSLCDRRHLLFGDGRRLRRDLWTAARLCALPPASYDLPDHLSRCRRAVRDHRRRACLHEFAGGAGHGVAHTAHLGGLVVGYLYLKRPAHPAVDELKYRYLRWKMGRARNRFDVY